MASTEIKSLIADVEDLVARIADLKDADVARVRTKVLGVRSKRPRKASPKVPIVCVARRSVLRLRRMTMSTTARGRQWELPRWWARWSAFWQLVVPKVASMRLLWSLPKAAPAILRHLVAYAELAGQDLEQTHRDIGAKLLASAVVGLCVFFVIFSGCLAVVALTWDTPYRVSAILRGWEVCFWWSPSVPPSTGPRWSVRSRNF